MNTGAGQIARFAADLAWTDVPRHVGDAAKLHLLDMLGCSLAAVETAETAAAAQALGAQGGTPEAMTVGYGGRLPAASAALVNGVGAHALDFDDTHEESICHVSAVVGPAAIAVAEAKGSAGYELLTAFVAGAETVCRVGMAASGEFHARGFHPTSVCGVFGATVAACRLYGLDAERTASAMGLAGSFAAGIFAYLSDGSPTKPLHAGWAAQAGVQATRLSAAGASGPPSVLEGRFGLYRSHTDVSPDLQSYLTDLGRAWETPRIAFKAYPACHFLHACVDAAVAAIEPVREIAPDQIARVQVRVPRSGAELVLEPPAEKARPRTTYGAKFSLPFSVASRLVHGSLDVTSYAPEALRDPAVLALVDRFDHTVWADGEAPGPLAGEATVELADGRRFHARVDHPRGSPSNPMTSDDVLQKFRTNASVALDGAVVDRMVTDLLQLEATADVRTVFAPLMDAGARARNESDLSAGRNAVTPAT